MSKTNTIITIGRQFGSGGRDIGLALSKELEIPFYDSEMLSRAAKDSGICQELFETHDEKPTSSFLYSLVMDTYNMGYSSGLFQEMPLNHKVFLAQFDTIKKIADEGPCVLVGRCADYALESYDNMMSVFIHADLDARIRRVARIHDLTDAKAKELIQKTDKGRASYYNYYTNKRWGDMDCYDFSLCSSELGIEGTVKALKMLVDLRENAKERKI